MDILEILKSNTDESGNIGADKLNTVAQAINSAVGKEFVDKKRYNEKLTEIDNLKGEKQTAEDKVTTAEKWKTKYDALKTEFETYKNDVTAKATQESKENAYKALLTEAGISEKRIATVLKAEKVNIDALELGEDGKFKDADKIVEGIKAEWADFITTTETQGATTTTPPASTGGAMTKDEIFAIKDAQERQKAIAANPEVFGL